MDALSAAELGMMNDMLRMHAISNNLANVSTAGFKRGIVVTKPFADYLPIQNGASASLGVGVTRPEMTEVTIHTPGTLKFTGNPLDLALESNSFFVLQSQTGPVYTRQGSFHLDAQGRLVSTNGFPVAGASGDIRLSTPNPVIDPDGRVWEGKNLVGQIQTVSVANPERLQKLGGGLFSAVEPESIHEMQNMKVHQNYLEMPNVVLTDEMVRMIETMRHFETSQRILQSVDNMLDRSINVLGEF